MGAAAVAENLIESVAMLERKTDTLLRIINGDDDSRHDGLLDSFEQLRADIRGLRDDLQRIKSRQPNTWLLLTGFFCFLASGLFAMRAVYEVTRLYNFLDIPVSIALSLAVLFASLSLLLFVVGFGWLGRM